MQQKYLILIFIALLVGVGAGFLFLKNIVVITAALEPNHPLVTSMGVKKPTVMGFLPYWLLSKATPDAVASLNSVTYFGLTITEDGSLLRLSTPQETEPGWYSLDSGKFTQFLAEKSYPSVEKSLLLHVSDEEVITSLLSNPEQHAQNLVSDAEPILKEYQFSDLNIDIESFKQVSDEEQAQMTTFLKEVKKQLVTRKLGTLTTELTVASLVKNHLLDPVAVGEISDRVVLMAYDFHYTGSYIAGAVAPVHGSPEKLEYDVATSVRLATEMIPAEKIILGIPLYGYEWETLSYEPESAVIPGTGKLATGIRATQLRSECSDCVIGSDSLTASPYIILPPNEDSSIQQIFYEDTASLQQKTQLAEEYQLGGIALWAVGYENPEMLEPIKAYKNSGRFLK